MILHTTDGGENWEFQQSGTSSSLYTLTFSNRFNGWAAGTDGTILNTTNGGATWTRTTFNTNLVILDLTAEDEKPNLAVGTGGMILRFMPAPAICE